jgi:hypothetical protein
MAKLSTPLLIVTLVGCLGAARPAEAAQGGASLQIGAQVGARARVEADRPAVTLRPGERVVVQVTVKARVRSGEPVALALEGALPAGAFTGTGAALVSYEANGVAGRLAGPAVVGTVRGSGVHRVAVAVELARGARGPVTVPLRFAALVGGAPVTVAAATQVQP